MFSCRWSRSIGSHLVDVRDTDSLSEALQGKDVVFHQAAAVGVGQSMYEIKRYVDINTLGTANLLNIIVNERLDIKKIIIPSSMTIYGEGKYNCKVCNGVNSSERDISNLLQGKWELVCKQCNNVVMPAPTDEEQPLKPNSIYAITKENQEEIALCVGKTYNIPTVVIRCFSVFGTRQSLSNPYTGVIAIFGARLLNNNPPLVFEDGLQTRDFIHVSDVVRANILCMEKDEANYQILNVGAGKAASVLEIANLLSKELGADIEPQVVNKYRKGDIRHCFADISKIKALLGYQPEIELKHGIRELIEWMKTQSSVDKVEKATNELSRKGLLA